MPGAALTPLESSRYDAAADAQEERLDEDIRPALPSGGADIAGLAFVLTVVAMPLLPVLLRRPDSLATRAPAGDDLESALVRGPRLFRGS